jgi:ABC-type transporter Mla subunit MlaD
VVNLEEKMQGMSRVSASLNNNYNMHALLGNANAQTQRLVAKEDNFNTSVNSALQNSGKLAKSGFGDDITRLRASLKSIGSSFRKLDTSMSGMGKMLNDKAAYESTANSFDTLNRNWKQLQKDPPGMSIFGGKKKK